jgi:hypothetical protein
MVNPVTTTTRVQLHPPRRPSAEATGWIRTDPSRPSRTLRAARTRVRPPQPFRQDGRAIIRLSQRFRKRPKPTGRHSAKT